jgi:hypothetical protein
LLFSLVQFAGNLLEQSSHVFLSVEHIAGLFVAFDVVLNFLLEVLVDSFVLEDTEKTFIDLTVQAFVLVG